MVEFDPLLVVTVCDVFLVAIYAIWHLILHLFFYIFEEIFIKGTAKLNMKFTPSHSSASWKKWHTPYVHLRHILLLPLRYHYNYDFPDFQHKYILLAVVQDPLNLDFGPADVLLDGYHYFCTHLVEVTHQNCGLHFLTAG